jgi:hypothetical protein
MSMVADVLRETATGATPGAVVSRLGLDEGLVEAMLDHAERMGLVLRVGCASCAGQASDPSCAGCPIAR